MFDECGDRVWIDPEIECVSPAVSWREADRNLRRIARQQSALDLELGRWLVIAKRTEVHRQLGLGSFVEYVERVLGFQPRATEDRLRVAAELEALPAISAALGTGAVSYSVVRDLTRVATPETETTWLAASAGKTAREVRELVAGREPGQLPTDRADPALERRPLHLELEPRLRTVPRGAPLRRGADGREAR